MNKLSERVSRRYLMKIAADPYTEASRRGSTLIKAADLTRKIDLKRFRLLMSEVGMNLIRLGHTTSEEFPDTWEDEVNVLKGEIMDGLKAAARLKEGRQMTGAIEILSDPKFVLDVLRRF